MTDTTLATIAKDSPELLKAAGLVYMNLLTPNKSNPTARMKYRWLCDGNNVRPNRAADLLCWAMVRELWEGGTRPTLFSLVVGADQPFVVQLDRNNIQSAADTPIAALYAVWLAARKES